MKNLISIQKLSALVVIFLSLVFMSAEVFAVNAPMQDVRQKPCLSESCLDYLEDPAGTLTINEVAALERAGSFTRVPGDTLTCGTLSSTFWFRFAVKSGHPGPNASPRVIEIAYPSLEQVSLFIPASSGTGWTVKTAGEAHPFSAREIPHRNFAFYLPRGSEGTVTCYARVFIEKVMIFPLRVWTMESFYRQAYIEQPRHLFRHHVCDVPL